MSDDYGNLLDVSQGEAAAAYAGYKAYGRVKPFVQGAINASQGAWLGADIGAMATGTTVKAVAGQALGRAAVATGIRTAATVGAEAAVAGVTAGATAGSVVPGIGTAIGAVAGAVAPFVVPHIPVVGPAINKIPLVGGIISPDKPKKQSKLGGGNWEPSPQNQHLQTPGQNVMGNRADYQAGRGFRREG